MNNEPAELHFDDHEDDFEPDDYQEAEVPGRHAKKSDNTILLIGVGFALLLIALMGWTFYQKKLKASQNTESVEQSEMAIEEVMSQAPEQPRISSAPTMAAPTMAAPTMAAPTTAAPTTAAPTTAAPTTAAPTTAATKTSPVTEGEMKRAALEVERTKGVLVQKEAEIKSLQAQIKMLKADLDKAKVRAPLQQAPNGRAENPKPANTMQSATVQEQNTKPNTGSPRYYLTAFIVNRAWVVRRTEDGQETEHSVIAGDTLDGHVVVSVDQSSRTVTLDNGVKITRR